MWSKHRPLLPHVTKQDAEQLVGKLDMHTVGIQRSFVLLVNLCATSGDKIAQLSLVTFGLVVRFVVLKRPILAILKSIAARRAYRDHFSKGWSPSCEVCVHEHSFASNTCGSCEKLQGKARWGRRLCASLQIMLPICKCSAVCNAAICCKGL